MTRKDSLLNKISATLKYLEILKRYVGVKDLQNDIDKKAAVERYLYLCIQSAIDVAEGLIAYQNLRKPRSYRECFEILHEKNIINVELMENLKKMVSFRNILSHDYEKFDFSLIENVLQHRLSDIYKLLEVVGRQT
jgi:uncharacterized protein YutE (UPF0331/DUF86 family)